MRRDGRESRERVGFTFFEMNRPVLGTGKESSADQRILTFVHHLFEKSIRQGVEGVSGVRQKTVAWITILEVVLYPIPWVIRVETVPKDSFELGEFQILESCRQAHMGLLQQACWEFFDVLDSDGVTVHGDHAIIVIPGEAREPLDFVAEGGDQVKLLEKGVELPFGTFSQMGFHLAIVRSRGNGRSERREKRRGRDGVTHDMQLPSYSSGASLRITLQAMHRKKI